MSEAGADNRFSCDFGPVSREGKTKKATSAQCQSLEDLMYQQLMSLLVFALRYKVLWCALGNCYLRDLAYILLRNHGPNFVDPD